MNKEMIISSNSHETVVAILEDDLVAEVFVERERHRGVVGNVYKGRVSKVLPGMQSSFIDIGLERDGFLYVAEVIDTLLEFEKLAGDDDDEEGEKNGQKEREGSLGSPAARAWGEPPEPSFSFWPFFSPSSSSSSPASFSNSSSVSMTSAT